MEIFAIVSVAFLNFAFAGISTRLSNTKLARFFSTKCAKESELLIIFRIFFSSVTSVVRSLEIPFKA